MLIIKSMSYFKKLFVGRINSGDFWIATILLSLFIYGTILIGALIGQIEELRFIALIFIIIFELYFFLIAFSVVIRRCHDIGKSGSFMFLNFVPIVNIYAAYKLYLTEDSKTNKYGKPIKNLSLKKIFKFS